MRTPILALAISLLTLAPAWADPPCFTEASQARAHAAMTPFLQRVTADAPAAEGMVWLVCDGAPGQRVNCTIAEQTRSPYRLGDAALAFSRELEMCAGEPVGRFRYPIYFMGDEASDSSTEVSAAP